MAEDLPRIRSAVVTKGELSCHQQQVINHQTPPPKVTFWLTFNGSAAKELALREIAVRNEVPLFAERGRATKAVEFYSSRLRTNLMINGRERRLTD